MCELLPDYIIGDSPKPAEFLVRKLFIDFTTLANKKIENILIEDPIGKPISKALQRGEDPAFDRILTSLGAVSEFCLPSLLRSLLAWYHHQLDLDTYLYKLRQSKSMSKVRGLSQNCALDDASTSESCICLTLDVLAPQLLDLSNFVNTSTAQLQQIHHLSACPLAIPKNSVDQNPFPQKLSNAMAGNNTKNDESNVSKFNGVLRSIASDRNFNDENINDNEDLGINNEDYQFCNLVDGALLKKRELSIEFVFCLALLEILSQLHLHPGHEDLINHIENLAFSQFEFRRIEDTNTDMQANVQNIHIIADLYAEVVGVLAQTRFRSVRRRFMSELKELQSKEQTPHVVHSVISLLMGMKFVRVKMVPIEDFEACFLFLQECGQYFFEVRSREIKHALAGLFVEVLVPVAASVKNEVNVPCLKNFVDMLYTQTLDMCTKKKHALTLFPLVTCLLCVSQRTFFLSNWHIFLSMCLSNLKNRDSKMCRVALESLYRLLWVYMIRIKCESNTVTQQRLNSIVYSLFPKGSKTVVPRDTPLNIFVKIIQFIAQERLDFAMKQVIFNLMSVDRPIKVIMTAERMNIGLRAFLLIADSLEQKEGEPPMPRSVGTMPSGCITFARVRKTYLNKTLTDDTARILGIAQYYPHIRRAFNEILRALDTQMGRPLLLSAPQNLAKDLVKREDLLAGDRKPKIDLFKTCIAVIPRLIPDGMSRIDLIDLLIRMTVHVDEEMQSLALQSLMNLIVDFYDWRLEILERFLYHIINDINDTSIAIVDESLRNLYEKLLAYSTSLNARQQQKFFSAFSTDFTNSHAQQATSTNYTNPISQLSLIKQTRQLLSEPVSLRKGGERGDRSERGAGGSSNDERGSDLSFGSIDRKQDTTVKRKKRRELLRNQIGKFHDIVTKLNSLNALPELPIENPSQQFQISLNSFVTTNDLEDLQESSETKDDTQGEQRSGELEAKEEFQACVQQYVSILDFVGNVRTILESTDAENSLQPKSSAADDQVTFRVEVTSPTPAVGSDTRKRDQANEITQSIEISQQKEPATLDKSSKDRPGKNQSCKSGRDSNNQGGDEIRSQAPLAENQGQPGTSEGPEQFSESLQCLDKCDQDHIVQDVNCLVQDLDDQTTHHFRSQDVPSDSVEGLPILRGVHNNLYRFTQDLIENFPSESRSSLLTAIVDTFNIAIEVDTTSRAYNSNQVEGGSNCSNANQFENKNCLHSINDTNSNVNSNLLSVQDIDLGMPRDLLSQNDSATDETLPVTNHSSATPSESKILSGTPSPIRLGGRQEDQVDTNAQNEISCHSEEIEKDLAAREEEHSNGGVHDFEIEKQQSESEQADCASFFWIAVIMLESDYDHEFHLALQLLHKCIQLLPLHETECMELVDKKMRHINWDSFPGVHALVLKGCTSPATYETTITVLDQLTPLLNHPIIDRGQPARSFTHSVMALLTYLMLNYDDPNPLCLQIARRIATWCNENHEPNSLKLDNLSTVMTLYSRRTFSKDRLQWVKCVVKYLYDSYSNVFSNIITFLVEVLDKGPSQLSTHIVSILFCIFHYVNIQSLGPQINNDLLKLINKSADSSPCCWREALKVFNLIVSRSSTLPTPTSAGSTMSSISSFHPVHQFGYHHSTYNSLPSSNSHTYYHSGTINSPPPVATSDGSTRSSTLPLNLSLPFSFPSNSQTSKALTDTDQDQSKNQCQDVKNQAPGQSEGQGQNSKDVKVQSKILSQSPKDLKNDLSKGSQDFANDPFSSITSPTNHSKTFATTPYLPAPSCSSLSSSSSTMRRELPGRTMECYIDIAALPIVAADLIVVEPPKTEISPSSSMYAQDKTQQEFILAESSSVTTVASPELAELDLSGSSQATDTQELANSTPVGGPSDLSNSSVQEKIENNLHVSAEKVDEDQDQETADQNVEANNSLGGEEMKKHVDIGASTCASASGLSATAVTNSGSVGRARGQKDSKNRSKDQPQPQTLRARPWLAQVHIRERLVSLLSGCGQRIGLPKPSSTTPCATSSTSMYGPSAIDQVSTISISSSVSSSSLAATAAATTSKSLGTTSSQPTTSVSIGSNPVIGSMESQRPSSLVSSTENMSLLSNTNELSQAGGLGEVKEASDTASEALGMFRDFDFLEYELESCEGDQQDNFNWGVRRRSLSHFGDFPDESLTASIATTATEIASVAKPSTTATCAETTNLLLNDVGDYNLNETAPSLHVNLSKDSDIFGCSQDSVGPIEFNTNTIKRISSTLNDEAAAVNEVDNIETDSVHETGN